MIPLKFVPKIQIQALLQIIALHQPGEMTISEPMMVSLLMQIWAIYESLGLSEFR